MARAPLGTAAGGIRVRLPPGGGRLRNGVSEIRVARPVLPRGCPRAPVALHPREGGRAGGVAADADGLALLSARRREEREALRIPRSPDGDDEFHLARDPGSLSDVPPEAAALRSPVDGGRDGDCDDRGDRRRPPLRPRLR